ncbi:type IV secretion system DNA-binding domain-containing protein [Patescibacteria group bacterium]|nr:type IV secretion system DNA-binding domain-containing protein [Patescibacteria group bacterium]MBU1015941.1 type IV secretion system DNA-binding domain-containing protein [Patescibacteria group bacterium]MBU1685500.1 type IV secretion system DNA-binding domain-containing protein [Patescibacteria group bacterium]MBU1938694.1 type IV secretion system DNA-binding domain-containing protein [Patescibacteria group bacterium]
MDKEKVLQLAKTALTWVQAYWLMAVIALAIIFYIIPLIIRIARFIFVHFMAKKLVYMKIELPRSDSKMDQEKRTEKDFKEKVAIMSQLYRALYEIRELNLWNLIKTKIWQADNISFELFVENQQLSFYVVVHEKYKNIIEKQITTFYNDADVKISTKPYDLFTKGKSIKAYFMFTKKDYWFPVNTFKNMEQDPLNDITNVFSKLEPNEKAAIQIIANPVADTSWNKMTEQMGTLLFKNKPLPIKIPIPVLGPIFAFFINAFRGAGGGGKTNAPGASSGDAYIRMLQPKEEAFKRIGEKAGQVGFDTSIRVVGVADNSQRATEIANNLNIAFSIYHDQYNNWFQNRRILPFDFINNPLMRYLFKRRIPGIFHKTNLLAQDELASIYHFPDSKYNPVPVIKWLAYKVLPPPVELPTEGVLIGNNVYRGQKREVRIMRDDRTRHQYIIGKSGSGKSVLLHFMARQDIWNGDGVCMVDPHGDLVEDTLQTVPKERARDVILFDPADTERPMGLNLLEAHTPEERDRASLDAMEIFIKIFGDEIFGPRIQHYFRNACLTLMEDEEEGATLIDVPRIFVDEEFLKYKLSKVTNSVVRSFWEHEYANTGDREKQEMIPYFSSKFGPFITNTTIRNIIGQAKSAFSIREVMDQQKILLVNLSKGKVGDLNAQLLGLIFVNKINMAAMGRQEIPKKDRKDFYLYVDEFQNFATDTFATILSEARKYRLSLIMAHQYIAQLTKTPTGKDDTRVRDAVFGNVGTMCSFKVGAEDAEYLAKEYAPTLSEQDILSIANYKAYIKLNIHNTTSRPFSIESIWDPIENPKLAEVLKKYSRMKYARKKMFVDQEIEARLGIT